ncbi:hypothetical protein MesoLjLc_10420 [Mesorhizobium sp. L-8-10]|uniref:hypothetical protein n=1 Tax=Mesorhizobium sp. L-8-10 TaxID=2744523 RepID=UPI0019385809|nr:hypothetical protein [Mesorhizobium sp. L-8-10]BCH29112.1 hypothetical protein MesoLjLc_10420 [Mesorhizobium sp. L-8-10]
MLYSGQPSPLTVALPVTVALMRTERVPQSREAHAARSGIVRNWTRAEVLIPSAPDADASGAPQSPARPPPGRLAFAPTGAARGRTLQRSISSTVGISDPVFYLLLVGTLAPAFIGTVIFFHQGYLVALRGYDPLAFAAAFPVMSVATIVFGLVCGHVIDRFGSLRLLPFVLLPLAVASVAAAAITPVWGIYVFMLLLGISNGFTFTLLGALWPEVYGLANLGGIRAITVSAMVFATAAGPGITGVLIDIGIGLPTQLLWMAAWCLVMCLVLAHAARRVRQREAQAAVPAQ